MTTVSELFPQRGPIASIQRGVFSVATATSGTSPDRRYTNITVSAVNDITKCLVNVLGSASTSTASAGNYGSNAGGDQTILAGRMTSTTNLRIYHDNQNLRSSFQGTWELVEYN